MQAADIMTTKVITVTPGAEVHDIAQILLDHRISAVPVLDSDDKLVGIVSEGDLVRRIETGTEPRTSWWLSLFGTNAERDVEFIKSHGRKAADVMTRNPITVAPGTPIIDVAKTLEKRRIKRVPVVSEGRLVGIISRANLLHGLASAPPPNKDATIDDRAIRDAILTTIREDLGISAININVIVFDGEVELWGIVDDDDKERAIIVAAETAEGVKAVESHLGRVPNWAFGV